MENKHWFEMDEEQRIKEVYSKFTIHDFWEWWSDGTKSVMEIRIRDYKLIKEVRKKFQYPISTSGVYITSSYELKNVIAYCRNRATIWFGIQPRKLNFNRWGTLSYGSGTKGGSSDYNVRVIKFLFIDIDRKVKVKSATKGELEQCNILSDLILERLGTVNWNRNYLKVCSGNGVQLLIKLDIPFMLPQVMFIDKTRTFRDNEEFDKIRRVLKDGIGRQIIKFSKRVAINNKLDVELDGSCFKVMVVGALPVTKNYKYNGYTWRGILEVKNGSNDGLSDYILNLISTMKPRSTLFKMKQVDILPEHKLIPGKLRENCLVKFMLENDLPYGMINNKIWFSLKILLRDSKVDLNSSEFKDLHKELERKYKGQFTLNIPDKKYTFNKMVINRYCVEYMFPLIYTIIPRNTKELDMKFGDIKWNHISLITSNFKLPDDTDIWEDMANYKNKFIIGDTNNTLKLMFFIKSCISKYGEDKTKYYLENLMRPYFIYPTVRQK